jgi:hypothetical protein
MNASAVPRRFGRPTVSGADIQRRRELWDLYRERLRMKAPDLAELTGLSVKTVRVYPSWNSPRTAPSWEVLDRMREECIRRARAAVREAESRLAAAVAEEEDIMQAHFEHVAETAGSEAA